MALRIKECAYKKSVTFIDNMKNFYFLLNQIEDMESNGGQVIIKNEISADSLIPTVEINIKNEIIYPNEDNHHHHHQVLMGSVIQQAETSNAESKRKRRKSNKRKSVNGQTMEIDETGNIVTRQILIATDNNHHHQSQQQHQNQLETQNNNEMALMLTVKQPIDSHHQDQSQTITVSSHPQIQIHSSLFN